VLVKVFQHSVFSCEFMPGLPRPGATAPQVVLGTRRVPLFREQESRFLSLE
jgi:hypothetical protein